MLMHENSKYNITSLLKSVNKLRQNNFKKQKINSKKRKNEKPTIMNNKAQKNEWNFEDDYNSNQNTDQQFIRSGETAKTNFDFENKHQKLFEIDSNQESHIKTKAMNLIEEEIKQKYEIP